MTSREKSDATGINKKLAISETVQKRGIGHVFKRGTSLGLKMAKLKLAGEKFFELGGKKYGYHYTLLTCDTERAVEVALAWDFVKDNLDKDILEVGNVLNNYYPFEHEVIDKYEPAPGILNIDIVDFNPGKKYDIILCVSTLEHVGFDEEPKDPRKVIIAIDHMHSLLKDDGKMLVTMPRGYNLPLDKLVESGEVKFPIQQYMKRISKDNKWEECTLADIRDAKYSHPFNATNGLLVGIIV